ncbi:unnamed protein product [Kuraishia capsulata CBS 1993]|uniref:Uncharacterized protein n=1 Tax=Kuraishia capsulata CBS 1993 TaxID=1382522 RepID=W6MNS8_9ASCO|nr:uncharacterized protein KUCA_T00004268001 [Kuraishia capsulata CBS 1993]CDK28286.1 unnamed protein product [Kuraishia capsulata CBS 1993]
MLRDDTIFVKQSIGLSCLCSKNSPRIRKPPVCSFPQAPFASSTKWSISAILIRKSPISNVVYPAQKGKQPKKRYLSFSVSSEDLPETGCSRARFKPQDGS